MTLQLLSPSFSFPSQQNLSRIICIRLSINSLAHATLAPLDTIIKMSTWASQRNVLLSFHWAPWQSALASDGPAFGSTLASASLICLLLSPHSSTQTLDVSFSELSLQWTFPLYILTPQLISFIAMALDSVYTLMTPKFILPAETFLRALLSTWYQHFFILTDVAKAKLVIPRRNLPALQFSHLRKWHYPAVWTNQKPRLNPPFPSFLLVTSQHPPHISKLKHFHF